MLCRDFLNRAELAADRRLPVLAECDVGGRSSHVECEDVVEPCFGGDEEGAGGEATAAATSGSPDSASRSELKTAVDSTSSDEPPKPNSADSILLATPYRALA